MISEHCNEIDLYRLTRSGRTYEQVNRMVSEHDGAMQSESEEWRAIYSFGKAVADLNSLLRDRNAPIFRETEFRFSVTAKLRHLRKLGIDPRPLIYEVPVALQHSPMHALCLYNVHNELNLVEVARGSADYLLELIGRIDAAIQSQEVIPSPFCLHFALERAHSVYYSMNVGQTPSEVHNDFKSAIRMLSLAPDAYDSVRITIVEHQDYYEYSTVHVTLQNPLGDGRDVPISVTQSNMTATSNKIAGIFREMLDARRAMHNAEGFDLDNMQPPPDEGE